ncbi:MAG TPA: hypothetical protein VGL38_08180 [bacterium]|jgi:vacuolar-type H+-ATPase subunit I/STV1
MDTNQIIPLRRALEEFGIRDFETMRKAAKKFGALITVAGIEYIDKARFESGLQTELQAKVDQAARRGSVKATSGRQLGLLKARIELAPSRIAAKEGAIVAARKKVEEAQNKYEKTRAKKALTELEAGLKRLQDNLAKDQAELDRLLNEGSAE